MGKSVLVLQKSEDHDLIELPSNIKILSWNIMGSNYCKIDVDNQERVLNQLNFLFNCFTDLDVDIIFLQEVDTFFKDSLDSHELKDKCYIFESKVEPYGQLILSKYKTNYEVYSIGKNGDKKIILLEAKVDDQKLVFVNCHLQAGRRNLEQRNSQIRKITDFLEKKYENKTVNFILGDLNMVTEEETIENYHDLCPENKREIYTFNYEENRLTFPIKGNHRFDRIYCNRKLDVVEYEVMTDVVLSDHYPIFNRVIIVKTLEKV